MFNFTELGIDLGSNSIKIAMVEKTGKSRAAQKNPTLTQLRHRKTYEVDVQPYSSEYFQLLKTIIKSFSKEHKLSRVSLNITVPIDNENAQVSFIKMPIVGDKLMDDGVAFEAEQNMAVEGIENSHFTWKTINEDTDLGEYEILLAYLKKQVVQSLAQFKTIKWRVNRVVLQPVVLERITEENDVVVDLGHKSTRVYMYKEGKLNQVEIIEMGGEELLKDIQEHLDENFIEDISPEDIIKEIPVYNPKIDELLKNNDTVEETQNEVLFIDGFDTEDDSENIDELEETQEDEENEVIFIDELPELEEEDSDVEEVVEEDDEVNFVDDYLDGEVEVLDESTDEDVTNEIEEQSVDDYDEEELYEELTEDEEEQVTYDEVLIKELSELLFPKVERIIDEVKRIIRMYELQNAITADSVYYVGQLAKVPFLKETIESELEVELKPISFLDMSEEGDEDVTYNLASLVSMDAGLKEPTNFSKFIKANVDYSSLIVILLMMSLSTGFAFKAIIDNYTDQLGEMQMVQSTQNQTISSLNSELQDLERSIDESERFISRMDMLKDQKNWLSDILYVVPERTPLTIAIHNLTIEDDEVVLQGYSSDYSSIGFFAESLSDIAAVEIDSIDEYSGGGDAYTVTLENPELISDKYKIDKMFTMTLTYEGPLLTR